MQSQKYLSDTFADLAQKSPELINEFTINAETQRQLIKYGESLLSIIYCHQLDLIQQFIENILFKIR